MQVIENMGVSQLVDTIMIQPTVSVVCVGVCVYVCVCVWPSSVSYGVWSSSICFEYRLLIVI